MYSGSKETFDTANVHEDGMPLKEPQTVCVEDATTNNFPNSLKTLRNKLFGHEVTELDVFAAILFTFAVECGYSWNIVDIPWFQRNYSFDAIRGNAIPSSMYIPKESQNEERRFILYLGGCENFKCTLWIKRLDLEIVVNVSTTTPLLCFSKAYNLSKYVNKGEINYVFLKDLSISSKNELFYKMKCYILSHHNVKNITSLNGLPPEIVLFIIKFLNAGDFLNLCKTCRYLYNYFKDDRIWKYFCKKYNFGTGNISPTRASSWKDQFSRRIV